MNTLTRFLARIFPAPTPAAPVEPSRVQLLRAHRIALAEQRAMDALRARPAGMSPTDQLLLARGIVTMLVKSLG